VERLRREEAEAQERRRLSPKAAMSDATAGRDVPIEPDPFRTEYQRDRDRIIHCKAFRRLSHKTQVFLAPEGDHYRTRLTHTLEVAQIARSVARTLRLNEDLTEAIALGHDLGHTPFGHIGEDALNDALGEIKGDYAQVDHPFQHNRQSLRIVEVLEYEGEGLNLTREVRDGIARHTGDEPPSTLEGRIVALADRVAYVNHDIDDALRAGVLSHDDLPTAAIELLGRQHGPRITTMVEDLVATSLERGEVCMSEPVWDAMMELRAFLFDNVYTHSVAKGEDPKAYRLVQDLFEHYLERPGDLPSVGADTDRDELPRLAVDYIAGMTDRFAIRAFERLFIPDRWMV
jgi:dGTPase